VRIIGFSSCRPRRRWRPSRPSCRPRAARPLRAAAACWPPRATGDHQLQLRRQALGAGPGRQRRPDRAAEPDGQPDERNALLAARLAAARAEAQLDRKAERVRALRTGPGVPARRLGQDHRQPPCTACASR
jgi:hypothetical protein